MKVYVQVVGAERFPTATVKNRSELQRVLDFARIGSQTGEPRKVYAVDRPGRKRLIGHYVGGESHSSRTMRARRSPLWGLVSLAAAAGLKRVLEG